MVSRNLVRPATALLSYEGLDAKVAANGLELRPAAGRDHPGHGVVPSQSCAQGGDADFFTIGCGMPELPKPVPFLRGLRAVHRHQRAASQNTATVETSNDLFNEVLCRSMSDLQMLMTNTPQGRYPYAGIPWYSTTFGRDGLITGAPDAVD